MHDSSLLLESSYLLEVVLKSGVMQKYPFMSIMIKMFVGA